MSRHSPVIRNPAHARKIALPLAGPGPSLVPRPSRAPCERGSGITKYGSTLYIGMDEVLAHYACTFENSDLHFHFQGYLYKVGILGCAESACSENG